MQLSVIIVNYNVKYFLEHCLLSVIKACKGLDAEILVADNGSEDGSRAYLEHKFPPVKFFWNKDNPGFAKANNNLLAVSKGEYVLFLNPDTIVPENCFTQCLSFFNAHADCGAIGVRMIDGSGKFLPESKRSLPSPLSGFFKMSGLAALFPGSGLFAGYYAGHLPEKENGKVEVLAGAFMMLSKKAIEKTKGFDEDFFMYGEDIDLSYRIIKAGLYNYYCGKITIIHFKGESTQKHSAAYIKNFYGAMKLFVGKHYIKSKLKNYLMKIVINAGKFIAESKAVKSAPSENSLGIKNASILIIGNEDQKIKIEKWLANKTITEIKSLADSKGSSPDKIVAAVEKENADTIIFCEGSLTNMQIIELLQILPNNCKALFYENSAESIIGSNDKNTKGIFISANV